MKHLRFLDGATVPYWVVWILVIVFAVNLLRTLVL